MSERPILIDGIECVSEGCDYLLECPSCGTCDGRIYEGALPLAAAQPIEPLADMDKDTLDVVLRIREHETHRLAKEDYLKNDGKDWAAMHERRASEIRLRERFGLEPHAFAACCKKELAE